MTVTRSDLRRLSASLGVLGTELEDKGDTAWLRLEGWEPGPTPAPGSERDGNVCVCNHTSEMHHEGNGACTFVREYGDDVGLCWCVAFTPAPSANPAGEDRQRERKDANRAGQQLAEFRADLTALDALVQSINRRLDMACPPDVSQLRNRRTGEVAFTETAGDIAAAGYCVSCWRNDHQLVAREKAKKSGLYYSPRYCRWCMDVKRAYGVEPPLDVLKLHHEGRRISVQTMQEAIAAAKPAKAKSKKKRKSSAA